MKLQKIITGLVLLVALIGGVLWVTMNSGIDTVMEQAGVSEAKDLVKYPEENPELFNAATAEVSPLYMFTILIGVILLIVTLMAVVSGLMKNKGSIKRVAIGALVFIAVLFVGYILSDTTNPVLENGKSLYRYGDDVATSSQIKMSGAGIIAFYILAGTAIGAMLLSGAKKIINK